MSPLAENSLYVKYANNPFYPFLQRGLNVTLSSDNPLQLHLTEEPLAEEYAIATQMFRLSNTDYAEVARNSILISGFPHYIKQKWLGEKYHLPGIVGNDINKTNISNIRLSFRKELLEQETSLISKINDQDHLNGSMVLNISPATLFGTRSPTNPQHKVKSKKKFNIVVEEKK